MENIVHWQNPDLAVKTIKALLAASISSLIILNFLPVRFLLVLCLWAAILKNNNFFCLVYELSILKAYRYLTITLEYMKGRDVLSVQVQGELPKIVRWVAWKMFRLVCFIIRVEVQNGPE
jgi:hypothetical protein